MILCLAKINKLPELYCTPALVPRVFGLLTELASVLYPWHRYSLFEIGASRINMIMRTRHPIALDRSTRVCVSSLIPVEAAYKGSRMGSLASLFHGRVPSSNGQALLPFLPSIERLVFLMHLGNPPIHILSHCRRRTQRFCAFSVAHVRPS